jgi:hypothetical protein
MMMLHMMMKLRAGACRCGTDLEGIENGIANYVCRSLPLQHFGHHHEHHQIVVVVLVVPVTTIITAACCLICS